MSLRHASRAPAVPKLAAVLCVLLALPAVPAVAHEYWLSPSAYRATAGDTLAIAAWAGTGFRGEGKPWAAPRALQFTLRTSRLSDLRPAAVTGDLTWGRFVAPDGGGALVGYASNDVPIELPADEFDQYLALEGLDGPRRARAKLGRRAGLGRERYARCPKTWIAGTDPARATAPLGLPLELVPLDDPSGAGRLRLRLLHRGHPLKGTLVRAWNRPLAAGNRPENAATRDSVGFLAQGRTNARGEVVLDARRPGEWLVSAVHMFPSENKAEADWQSLWASLTFARTGRP